MSILYKKFKKPLHLIALFVFLAFVSFYAISIVHAGSLSSAKVTITDSRAGQASTGHTFDFTTGTTGTITSVVFQYCTTASGTCTTPTGLVTTGGSQGALTGLGASTSNFTTNGTITLTVTSPASVPASTAITVPYTGITNPSTINTSFFVRITTQISGPTTLDTVTVASAVLDTTSLSVTASVDPTFTFSVSSVATGTVNGTIINATGSASTIAFGTLSAGFPKIAANDVSVTTNAGGGYNVTVKALASPPLVYGSHNIDEFTGSNATPAEWSAPAGSSESVNTGFFGYTTSSTTLCTGTATRFVGNKWAGTTTSPLEVACNSAWASGTQTTRIGWQAEANGNQAPGVYTGTVILVATPTY